MYKYYNNKYTMAMEKNCIDCDVASCIYNNLGKECTLKNVKITKDFTELTYCGSYKNKLTD